MIDKREILEKAGELSLEPKVIEKDYVPRLATSRDRQS
jgi:hypothetical protein